MSKRNPTKITARQMEVLWLVCKGNPDEPHAFLADLDQILERLSVRTTKEAMQFTVRALIANGLIEKAPRELRRERLRVTYQATALGLSIGKPAVSTILVSEEDDALEALA
jgi:hypothetical protein